MASLLLLSSLRPAEARFQPRKGAPPAILNDRQRKFSSRARTAQLAHKCPRATTHLTTLR